MAYYRRRKSGNSPAKVLAIFAVLVLAALVLFLFVDISFIGTPAPATAKGKPTTVASQRTVEESGSEPTQVPDEEDYIGPETETGGT